MSTADHRMAMTVIGGYLGSGKTTLLNHLLRSAGSGGEKIAVLVNDFGDINIDLDLIESRDDNTIELSNGCICCSMVDGFAQALDTITDFEPRPDRLVIETSGVADPAQVAGYGHGPGLALDAVIVMVDVETIRTAVGDKYVGQTVTQQLAGAEVLVANKADLVSSDELDDVVAWLRDRCPEAFVLTSINSEVPPEVLFGRVSMAKLPTAPPSSGAESHHHPQEIFAAETWSPSEPQRRDQIAAKMDSLPDSVVRAKGFVWLDGEAEPFVLQRVGRRWTLRRSRTPWPDAPATNIVIISAQGDDGQQLPVDNHC